MKSISKLVLVVLLLAGSYKMYGQSGGCGSNAMQACMNVALWQFADCESFCGTPGGSAWAACISGCNWEMCDSAWACGVQYGCNVTSNYCNNPNDPYDPD
jgi:hypothetical protein